MKRKIEITDYAGKIMEQTSKGILLTTKAKGQVNSMTIGWGFLGIQWAKPIFVVLGAIDKNILGVCGTKSGRDMDKIAALGLTLEEGETVSVPAIKELPLTLECKVIYKQDQDPSAIAPEDDIRFYAKGTPNEEDYHTAYYGQITAAYIVE